MYKMITVETEMRICPKCGSDHLRMYIVPCRKGNLYNVICAECEEEGPIDCAYNGAVDAWNHYHPRKRLSK
jgi:hypothetical protein